MRYRQMLDFSLVVFLSLVMSACTEDQIQARGFVLPEGDPVSGQAVFVELQCQQCHSVRGVTLDADATMRDGPTMLELGGQVTRIKTYGELVTAIIHPSVAIRGPKQEMSRPDGTSWMTDYNDAMTVQEMIDLVAFIKPRYQVVTPGYAIP